MALRGLLLASAIVALTALPGHAQEPLVTYKMLSPELALDSARAALAECRKRGYQVAVAVVDRFGVTQVMLRDRFAGAHTPATAAGKAWTAASFRTDTSALMAISQPGMPQAGPAQSAGRRHPWRRHDHRSGRFDGRCRRRFRRAGRRRRRCLRQGRNRRDTRQAGFLKSPRYRL